MTNDPKSKHSQHTTTADTLGLRGIRTSSRKEEGMNCTI